jgi:hypothetical protein
LLTSVPTYTGILPASATNAFLCVRCALQWVFFLFGASAVLWLPLWLRQDIAGGSGAPSSRSRGSRAKGFTLLTVFGRAEGSQDSVWRLAPERELEAAVRQPGSGLARTGPTSPHFDDAGGLAAGPAVAWML